MKTKIIIAGIGGVGGYFGGLLARHFHPDDQVEINFLARGPHLDAIQKEGLQVIHGDDTFIARPARAADHAETLGPADFILIATKTFGLDAIARQLRPCITPETVVLPLLNGLDSKDRIQAILPDANVAEGCAYISARKQGPGVVENLANIEKVFFGGEPYLEERLKKLELLMQEAKIEATYSPDIATILWEKFIFISPTATATSYYDATIGEVVADPEKLATTIALIEEVKQLAQFQHVPIAPDITDKTVNRLKSLPFGTISSLHADFQKGNFPNEVDSLTGWVVEEGKRMGIATPNYAKLYTGLLKRSPE